ncbi:hypothetical protein M2H33_21615 [Vibrio vulnificus]|nr:hypothetical protein [Vibrio vulnificus]
MNFVVKVVCGNLV